MKKLTAAQMKRREELVEKFKNSLEALNIVRDEIEEFRNEVVGNIEDYMSERSEKWHESDAASNYGDWKSSWEALDSYSDIENSLADDLEELPVEVPI